MEEDRLEETTKEDWLAMSEKDRVKVLGGMLNEFKELEKTVPRNKQESGSIPTKKSKLKKKIYSIISWEMEMTV